MRRLLVVGLLFVSVAALAQLRTLQTRTSLVRLDGTWGAPQAGHAAADLSLEDGKTQRRMQVETARVLMGDRSGPDVLAEASGRRPGFRLRGPRELLDRLATANAGEHVEITGYLRSGSPDLQVTSVTVGAAPG